MAYLGFDRRITLDWLDETAGVVLHTTDPVAVRAALHTQLTPAIAGAEARVKTITLLCRVWLNPPTASYLRDTARDMLPVIAPTERLWLHWGLTLLAFPFFRDVVTTVGRLLHIQGNCTVGQVTDRMISAWGERSTLIRATQRTLRSLVDWGVLAEHGDRGRFAPGARQRTTATALQLWLLEASLRAHPNEGMALDILTHLQELFPFDLVIERRDIMQHDQFEILAQGSGVDLVYPTDHVVSHCKAVAGTSFR